MTTTLNWKVWLERTAMACIALGIFMIVQGFTLQIYGVGFLIVIAGTLIFIVVSHL
jgi:hypothetical protein